MKEPNAKIDHRPPAGLKDKLKLELPDQKQESQGVADPEDGEQPGEGGRAPSA